MSQRHGVQIGMFHITTNTKQGVPWCIFPGIPEVLIDNLVMTKNLLGAKLYTFCILPDHMHMILSPGEKGLSKVMHSFKRNSMRDIRNILNQNAAEVRNLRDSGRYGSSATLYEMIAWQKSFFEERIQSSKQCGAAMAYVQGNAMHHNLVDDIEKWPWTSLCFPHVLDPMEMLVN